MDASQSSVCGLRSNSSSHLNQLPRILAADMEKFAMLRIPFTVQDRDHWCSAFARGLRALGRCVVWSQVGDSEARTVSEDLEALAAIYHGLTHCNHIQSSLARTIGHGYHVVACRGLVCEHGDGACARADIHYARSDRTFPEERREGFKHQVRASDIGSKALRHLLRQRAWHHGYGGIVDERIEPTFHQHMIWLVMGWMISSDTGAMHTCRAGV